MRVMSDARRLSVNAIQSRIREIDQKQGEYDRRDFDEEVKEAILRGFGVESVEDEHLQAERAIRRLRVERQMLEEELQEKERVKQDVLSSKLEMEGRLRRMGELAKQIDPLVQEIVPLLMQLRIADMEHHQLARRLDLMQINRGVDVGNTSDWTGRFTGADLAKSDLTAALHGGTPRGWEPESDSDQVPIILI